MLNSLRTRFVCRNTYRHASSLTSVRYPHIKRREDLAPLSEKNVAVFERILGGNNVMRDDLDGFNEDWLGIYKGASTLVLRPHTSEQLSAVMKECNTHQLGVCVQSGNTGLVGGGVPVHDEVIVNMSQMLGDISFDGDTGILRTPAGHTLQHLDETVNRHGYAMPLDLGAKGSCQIGGNIATAAGGIRFVRYGSLHAHVLGMTVVQANGDVVNLGNNVRKDNTGLHLAHLYVGSEGQLGIVTDVTMCTVPLPSSVNVAMLAVSTFDNCLKILRNARKYLGEIMSAFEFIDNGTMDCIVRNLKLACPLGNDANFYLLIETHGSNKAHDEEKMENFLEYCMSEELCTDGVPASSDSQAAHMWAIRERAAEALKEDGHTYKQDISLSLKDYNEVCEHIRERVGHLATRVVLYGHLADGNAHLNITCKEYSQEVQDLLYPYLYEWVAAHNGSISAEHGIGFAKRPYIQYSQCEQALGIMKQIKRSFDPKGILNPYKTIPD